MPQSSYFDLFRCRAGFEDGDTSEAVLLPLRPPAVRPEAARLDTWIAGAGDGGGEGPKAARLIT